MPLSDKESIAEADFIFVENPEIPVDTTAVAIRKRMKSGMAWIEEKPYPEIRF